MSRIGGSLTCFYPVVRWLLVAQLTAGLAMAVLVWLVEGKDKALSTGVGVLTGYIPNVYFSFRFGIRNPSKTARQVVRSFYGGEAVKLMMTAGLFAVAFQVPGISYGFMFAGFALVIGVSWFALLVRGNNKGG